MSTKDLILLSTFVNALILGLLITFSNGEEVAIIPPAPQKPLEKVSLVLSKASSELVKEEIAVMLPVVEMNPPISPLPLPPAEEWYTIKSGDNPWKIAKTQKIKFDDLLKLNGLNEERARNLKPGDRIRIR